MDEARSMGCRQWMDSISEPQRSDAEQEHTYRHLQDDRLFASYLARCFIKGLCEQCPAKSWMEHGTLDSPIEYLCKVAHAQARYLGLVNEGENAWEVKDWKERIRNFSLQNHNQTQYV